MNNLFHKRLKSKTYGTFGGRMVSTWVECFDNGRLKEAIDFISKSIKFDPKNDEAYRYRGETKLGLDDYWGGIEDFNKAIQINPNNVAAYSARGFCNDQIGDKKAAVFDHTKAIEISSENSYSYYHRGIIKSEWGDYKGAISDFNQAILIDPNIGEAYSSRGFAKSQLRVTTIATAPSFSPPKSRPLPHAPTRIRAAALP